MRLFTFALAGLMCMGLSAQTTVDLQGMQFKVDTLRHYYIANGVTQSVVKFSAATRSFKAFVTDYDKQEAKNISPRVIIGRDSCNTAETVSSMARRHTTGSRQVLAGINGDFFITSGFTANHPLGNRILGYPNTTCIIDGKLAAPDIIDKASRENCLVIGSEGWWIDATDLRYRLLDNSGSTVVDAMAVNYPRQDHEMMVYNSYAGKYTKAPAGGREIALVPVQGAQWRVNKTVKFEVASDWSTSGNMAIPQDGIVISCGKDYSNEFIDGLKPGDTVKLKIVCSLPAFDGLKPDVRDVVGGDVRILNQGVTVKEAIRFINTPTALYSRSLVGYDRDRRHMVICSVDAGGESSGVSYFEAADVMRFLGCWDALDLDGGGSTEMWSASHGVINNLRDGSERAVGNALFFTLEAPADGEVSSIRFADHRITLPKYGIYKPVIYGYNRYGQLVDTDFKDFTLSAPRELGDVIDDGKALLAGESGTYILTATFGNVKSELCVTVADVESVSAVTSKMIVDQYHKWTVELESTVGDKTMAVSPLAYSWTSSDSNIAVVNDKGEITGVSNGNAVVTGTNSLGSVTVNVVVQCPDAAKMSVDRSEFDVNSWRITKSGVNTAAMSALGDNGFAVDCDIAGGRSPRITLLKSMDIWGVPDAIELELKLTDVAMSKICLSVTPASSRNSVLLNLIAPEAGEVSVLRIPVGDIADAKTPLTYPLHFNSLAFYPTTTGKARFEVKRFDAVYDSFTGGVDDITVDNTGSIVITTEGDMIHVPFKASALRLYNMNGNLVASASSASMIKCPAHGMYVLVVYTPAGVRAVKLVM